MTSKVLESLSKLCRVAVAILCVPMALMAQSQPYTHFKVIHTFHNNDGNTPQFELIMDNNGNLYGTTSLGGDLSCFSGYGCGTVFKISKSGQTTVLHNFEMSDGLYPQHGHLVRDAAGNFYGTTNYGGDLNCSSYGCGVAFKLDSSGKETVLYEFTGTNGDGTYPGFNSFILEKNGDLYGTTYGGGQFNCGTVFKIDAAGTETVLYAFKGTNGDGCGGEGLTQGADGYLYGLTLYGGISCPEAPNNGCGTVFQIDKSGTEKVLHAFSGTASKHDGANPIGGVILDSKGNLYGTTDFGGLGVGALGTVFMVTKAGTEKVLYRFDGVHGGMPTSPLVRDKSGNLYGTANAGGAYGYGVVFKLTPAGKETVLHSFTGADDENREPSGLLLDSSGHLYGVTATGGDPSCTSPIWGPGPGCGLVFEITQ